MLLGLGVAGELPEWATGGELCTCWWSNGRELRAPSMLMLVGLVDSGRDGGLNGSYGRWVDVGYFLVLYFAVYGTRAVFRVIS